MTTTTAHPLTAQAAPAALDALRAMADGGALPAWLLGLLDDTSQRLREAGLAPDGADRVARGLAGRAVCESMSMHPHLDDEERRELATLMQRWAEGV